MAESKCSQVSRERIVSCKRSNLKLCGGMMFGVQGKIGVLKGSCGVTCRCCEGGCGEKAHGGYNESP